MSNIAKAFEHGKAFIPFITCGYPDLETTEKIVYSMVDAGADLIDEVPPDGELPVGRKGLALAVRCPHPASHILGHYPPGLC